ncbi:lipocalin-like domain-containing protein [Sphingorhabdus sp.]|jgi:hypothetical protein|uniref:lipocalin-like domain-containing protein n=1 Tax=Sphingorhabdus sp. TaxID=1902408 RepID=UPI003BB0B877|nr:lipocalin-like domain-containing protein [Sphingomonadales bacterium]
MSHKPENFVGTWKLVDWRIEYSDGSVTRPFGEGAHGYIIYSADGTMTASIAKATRPPFGIANARNANAAQKIEAFDSYFHYAGPWRIEDDEVVHSVTMSLNPDMTGTEQRRLAVFDDADGLTLSAKEALKDGACRHHILQWEVSRNSIGCTKE